MMKMPPASATLSRRSRPQAIWLRERPSICFSPTSTASGSAIVALGSSNVLRTASPVRRSGTDGPPGVATAQTSVPTATAGQEAMRPVAES